EEVLLVIPRRRAAGDERNSTATLGHATIRMPSAPADAIQTTDTLTSGSAATLADGLAAAHTTSTLTLDALEPDTTETSASLNGGDSSAETTPTEDRGGAAAESGDATE